MQAVPKITILASAWKRHWTLPESTCYNNKKIPCIINMWVSPTNTILSNSLSKDSNHMNGPTVNIYQYMIFRSWQAFLNEDLYEEEQVSVFAWFGGLRYIIWVLQCHWSSNVIDMLHTLLLCLGLLSWHFLSVRSVLTSIYQNFAARTPLGCRESCLK